MYTKAARMSEATRSEIQNPYVDAHLLLQIHVRGILHCELTRIVSLNQSDGGQMVQCFVWIVGECHCCLSGFIPTRIFCIYKEHELQQKMKQKQQKGRHGPK